MTLRAGPRASSATPSPSSRPSSSRSRTWPRRSSAARLLTWRAASLRDAGQEHTVESSMAKLFASEAAVEVALEAVQIHGGYGYIKEYPVERYLRDSQARHHRRGHERGPAPRDRARAACTCAGWCASVPACATERRPPRWPPRRARARRRARDRAGDQPRRGRRARGARALLSALFPHAGRALVVGVTGPPGRRQVDAGRPPDRAPARARAGRSASSPSIPPRPTAAARSSATASACRRTPSTPASSSARWPRAATWAAWPPPPATCSPCCPRRARTWSSWRRSASGQDEVEIVGDGGRQPRRAGARPGGRGAGAEGRHHGDRGRVRREQGRPRGRRARGGGDRVDAVAGGRRTRRRRRS